MVAPSQRLVTGETPQRWERVTSAIEAMVTINDAVTFSETATVRALCSERGDSAVQMTDARLRAVRVASVTEQ